MKKNIYLKTNLTNSQKQSDTCVLSQKYAMKVRNRRWKKFSLYIQRVESSIYDKLGFSCHHYIHKPINKGATSYLITSASGEPMAFIAFLNHTFKGCSNGMMVSRFVILPKYQGKGLSVPILSKVCGMYSAKGMRVFINTENPKLGNALGRSQCFKGTAFDQKKRLKVKDCKCANRRGGCAWRKEYCGRAVMGYGRMMLKIKEMRKRRENVTSEASIRKESKRRVTYYTSCMEKARNNSVQDVLSVCDVVRTSGKESPHCCTYLLSDGSQYQNVAIGVCQGNTDTS